MAPSWIHTGGAYQYTGYVINEGSASYQHGSTKAYFYKVARNNTWAEAYLLGNIAFKFDLINGTPGVSSPPDFNGSALYGDPGMNIKMCNEGVFMQPLFTNELTIDEGIDVDTITYRITMNRDGNPGYTSKWGERHPIILLPFRAENVNIIYTDAIAAVVEDNFALMYIWYQNQPSLAQGETREVIFTCNHIVTGISEAVETKNELADAILYQNYPNPFKNQTTISYQLMSNTKVSIKIYNISGQEIRTLVNKNQAEGKHSVFWDGTIDSGKTVPTGVYFYNMKYGDTYSGFKKVILMK
jgi:hypothetical protein